MATEIDRSGTPLVELRNMRKAFGGIRAVDDVRSTSTPARWSASSATTARASRC
jgi:ABC-type sugar transport system ATPase subunit